MAGAGDGDGFLQFKIQATDGVGFGGEEAEGCVGTDAEVFAERVGVDVAAGDRRRFA